MLALATVSKLAPGSEHEDAAEPTRFARATSARRTARRHPRPRREIETNNLLLGTAGDLGCTTLVELGADWQARHAIDELSGLGESFYVRPAVEQPCERAELNLTLEQRRTLARDLAFGA